MALETLLSLKKMNQIDSVTYDFAAGSLGMIEKL